MEKAKVVAHEMRRAARSEEFSLWDIKVTIPAESEAAEAERQKIRDKYAVLQTQIDSAKTPEELLDLVS